MEIVSVGSYGLDRVMGFDAKEGSIISPMSWLPKARDATTVGHL